MPGKFFSFSGKNMISPEKFVVCPENFFILGKKCDISGKIFGVSRKFFEMTYPPTPPHPVANISDKKILGALFHSKSAPQSLPPPPNL
jgi:hypothetical protein